MVAWVRSVRDGNSQTGIQWAESTGTGAEDPAWEVPTIACSLQRQLEGIGGLHVEAQATSMVSCSLSSMLLLLLVWNVF